MAVRSGSKHREARLFIRYAQPKLLGHLAAYEFEDAVVNFPGHTTHVLTFVLEI